MIWLISPRRGPWWRTQHDRNFKIIWSTSQAKDDRPDRRESRNTSESVTFTKLIPQWAIESLTKIISMKQAGTNLKQEENRLHDSITKTIIMIKMKRRTRHHAQDNISSMIRNGRGGVKTTRTNPELVKFATCVPNLPRTRGSSSWGFQPPSPTPFMEVCLCSNLLPSQHRPNTIEKYKLLFSCSSRIDNYSVRLIQ